MTTGSRAHSPRTAHLLALAAALAAGGCNDSVVAPTTDIEDEPTPATDRPAYRPQIDGMWHLIAVNGQPLPYLEEQLPNRETVLFEADLYLSPLPIWGGEMLSCTRTYGAGFPTPGLGMGVHEVVSWSVDERDERIVTINFEKASSFVPHIATLRGAKRHLIDFSYSPFLRPTRTLTFRKAPADEQKPRHCGVRSSSP